MLKLLKWGKIHYFGSGSSPKEDSSLLSTRIGTFLLNYETSNAPNFNTLSKKPCLGWKWLKWKNWEKNLIFGSSTSPELVWSHILTKIGTFQLHFEISNANLPQQLLPKQPFSAKMSGWNCKKNEEKLFISETAHHQEVKKAWSERLIRIL